MKQNRQLDMPRQLLRNGAGAPPERLARSRNLGASDHPDPDDLPIGDEPAEPELREIAAEELEGAGHGPDDALGLYLRQMGAIPLLNRTNEIEVAQRLERTRNRFRIATLRCRFVIHKAITMFEKISAGQTALDPNVDVVSTSNLRRDQILARMPGHLRTLRNLLKREDEDFERGLLLDNSAERKAWRRRRLLRLKKMSRLLAELSPRTEVIEQLVDDLAAKARRSWTR